MKPGNILLLGMAGVAVYELTQLGVAGNTMQIVFSGIDQISPLKYNLNFLIQNISNAAINFRGLTGAVTINNNPVGTVSDFNAVKIAPVSQQQISVSLSLSVLQLPSAVIDLINNSGGKLDFNVTGNMNVDTLVLPFSVDNSLTV